MTAKRYKTICAVIFGLVVGFLSTPLALGIITTLLVYAILELPHE